LLIRLTDNVFTGLLLLFVGFLLAGFNHNA
jgi:hypothetical protein